MRTTVQKITTKIIDIKPHLKNSDKKGRFVDSFVENKYYDDKLGTVTEINDDINHVGHQNPHGENNVC